MKNANTARLPAWGLLGIFFALAASGIGLQISAGVTLRNFGFPAIAAITVIAFAFGVIAALLVIRHPSHPIGWMMYGLIIIWGVDLFTFGYAYYGLIARPGSLPGAEAVLVWQSWSGGPFILVLSTLMILHFPNGLPLSPGWGRIPRLLAGAMAVFLLLDALEPGPLEVFPYINNPLGVPGEVWAVLTPLRSAAIVLGFVCILAAIVSLVLRWHRAVGDERQQIKWFAYGASYFALTLVMVLYGELRSDRNVLNAALVLHPLSLVGLLGSTAIAIFRYRLYEIDRIINRTLVYGILSAVLGLSYFTIVTVLQSLLGEASGQSSQIAIVVSTLAIAALFNPLRSRIQEIIDRRFYRRRYDAEKALAAIAATARAEVDLIRLSEAILGVVEETMQPERVSLWLEIEAGSS